jgi:hypothetical protein
MLRCVDVVIIDISEETFASKNPKVPSTLFLVALMMEVIRSSETSVLTSGTRRNIPEDSILHSHRRENLKSYIALTGWTL